MDATVVISTATKTVEVVGGVLTTLNQLLGGGLLAILVKLAIDGLKLILPNITLMKRLLPVFATALAIVIWAMYQVLTGQGDFASLITVGLTGGLGAIGLNEIVNTSIKGHVVPVVPAESVATEPAKTEQPK